MNLMRLKGMKGTRRHLEDNCFIIIEIFLGFEAGSLTSIDVSNH